MINPSLAQWFSAAQSSRADMLLLGDSMVWSQGNGWDQGIIDALSKHTGLAGSGLLQSGSEGDGYQNAILWQSPFDLTQAAVRPDRQGYVWRSAAVTAGSTPTGTYASTINGTTTLPNAPKGYDLLLYTVPTANATQGTLNSWLRLAESPWSQYTSGVTSTVQTPAAGLSELTLHYDPPASSQGHTLAVMVDNVTNLSILYSRLIVPGAKGASLTSWGYGGHSALSFYQDMWMGEGVTPAGRTAWFNALTEGGSGKVNVVIEEGFNDRGDTRMSMDGVHLSNTLEGFGANITGFMNQIRSEWTASGRNVSDLTFTLLGTYQDRYEEQAEQTNQELPLHAFATALAQIAQSDPQVSFIDMLNHAPHYTQANDLGYMFDDVHASRAGTTAYGEMLIDTLQSYAGVNTTGGSVWKTDAAGNWSAASSWNGAVPNAVDAMARLSDVTTDNRTVTLDVPVTVGTLQFDNPNGYTVAGNTLTLSSSSGPARLNVMSGQHLIASPVKFASPVTVTVPYGSRLTLSGDMIANAGATLTKAGGGEMWVKHLRAPSLSINSGSVHVLPNGSASGVSYLSGLTIAPGATLDLNDNDLVLGYSGASPIQALRAMVNAGFSGSAAAGKTGLVSTSSQQDGGHEVLALFDNALVHMSEWPPGSGHTIAANSIVGKYTYFGDVTLDGQVTMDDFLVLDANRNTSPAPGVAWTKGDMNGDGTVNSDDNLIWDANRGLGVGHPLTSGLTPTPEPAAATLLTSGAIMLMRRRRRNA